jgi:sterol desaturase/sphingolipid hydroxylase (fatty acid hydroxylase superfamily)
VYTMYGQQIWSSLTATWNLDDLGYTASFILSNGLFWLLALFFFILDTMPERFNKYRVQSFRPVKLSDYKKAFVTAMVNTFLVSIPFGYPVHLLYKHLTRDVDLRVLPSPREVVTDHIAFIIILEIGKKWTNLAFYYSHMLMHQPLFYKYIHKKHHEFVAPVAMAAVYAHPIEHIISNLTPIILGPIVMRSHIVTYWIWWMLTITGTMINHSCYCLPGMGSPVNHDFHHYMQQENFGVFGILDHLHHTDA